MIILDMEKPNSCAECELRFCGICEQGYDKEPCPIKAEIPDGVTNGDVIKALFGRPAREGKTGILYKFKYHNGKPMFSTYFDIDWWDAPYGGMKNG